MDGAPGAASGGISGLVVFLREHGGAVEADLQHYYGVRLSDLTTGRLTWRRLKVLLEHLPRGSALARAALGDDAEWGLSEQLLASIIDVLNVSNWQRSGKGKPPRPVPRPGVKGPGNTVGRSKMSPVETREYLSRFRPREEVTGGD